MSYFKPYIDSAGLHIPTYIDIRDQLIEDAKATFGNDIYLEQDSADYQFISATALKWSDSLQATEIAFNNRSPATAIGIGLDGVVKLNGIVRKPASYSTCTVTITGTAGAIITNGSVKDTTDNVWNLPSSVEIGESGTIDVLATCNVIGAISAPIGSITTINTPTQGWISVTNNVAAVTGQKVETDAELRARQKISVTLPSQTLLSGTKAGILQTTGVTRAEVYENDTNLADVSPRNPYGLPPHSVTAVVEGGADYDIAEQIFLRKGIGVYTNGDVEIPVMDIYSKYTNIRFYRPTYIYIYAIIVIRANQGYDSSIIDSIKSVVNTYLNGLSIGNYVYLFGIYNAISQLVQNKNAPAFSVNSVTIGKTEETQSTSDIAINYNEIAQTSVNYITVTVV